MKKLLFCITGTLILTVLLAIAFLAIITLCLAMPDILEWLSGYIGGFMTWTLFFLSIALFVSYCINSK